VRIDDFCNILAIVDERRKAIDFNFISWEYECNKLEKPVVKIEPPETYRQPLQEVTKNKSACCAIY
jgi:hypothetical protein